MPVPYAASVALWQLRLSNPTQSRYDARGCPVSRGLTVSGSEPVGEGKSYHRDRPSSGSEAGFRRLNRVDTKTRQWGIKLGGQELSYVIQEITSRYSTSSRYTRIVVLCLGPNIQLTLTITTEKSRPNAAQTTGRHLGDGYLVD